MAGSRTECRADRRCGSGFARGHTHLDLLDEHSGRHARFFGQPDRQVSSTIQGRVPNHSAPVCKRFTALRERANTVSPTSQSKNSGRSGQHVSCGAWSAKHSRSDTNVSLSSRAKHVTPADTSWRPCFARQRQRLQLYTKEVDGTAKLQNKKWVTADRKPGRNDETEVAVTERYLARTLSDQETPFSSTPL